jgi:predicted GNAT superfamily acetyltransferase
MVVNAEIRELTGVRETLAATDLITEVWQAQTPPVPFPFLRALSLAGAPVLGGFVAGHLAAVAVGFFGSDPDGPLLHSHVVGVGEKWRGTGLGQKIKIGQRAWCLERGVTRMAWTLDPLRAGNAYFNLTRLGATGVSYHADFYGQMNDAFNRGIPTDRVLVHWDLTGSETSRLPAPDSTDRPLLGVGAMGEPVHRAADRPPGQDVRLRVPATIPAAGPLALRWRLALREAMEPLLRSGYRWTAAGRDGTYVLTPALSEGSR